MAQLNVMTFNVRQLDGDDGEHAWEFRRDLLIETIALHRPSLLGTQEIHTEQTEYILQSFPEYRSFGRGRYGDDRDKHCKIFFNRSEFSLLETGEIWMSETPDVAGSSAWDIPKPRMITWGRLRTLDGSEIVVLNTHFPYGRGADVARAHAARLTCEKIASLPPGDAIILMGDFNSPANGEVYASLTANLQDTWTATENRTGPESTVHGFGRFTGGRIDWILSRNAGTVTVAETVTHAKGGLYPSDHYPVCATFDR